MLHTKNVRNFPDKKDFLTLACIPELFFMSIQFLSIYIFYLLKFCFESRINGSAPKPKCIGLRILFELDYEREISICDRKINSLQIFLMQTCIKCILFLLYNIVRTFLLNKLNKFSSNYYERTCYSKVRWIIFFFNLEPF